MFINIFLTIFIISEPIIMRKRFCLIALITVSILLIPFVAMQFTDEVNWGILDFLVAAFLLFTTGCLLDLIIRRINKPSTKLLLSLAILLIFFLIWAELAVGIFGTPFGGS